MKPVAVDSPPRAWFPAYCEVCEIFGWLPTQKQRNEWEYGHQHGGVD